ncbi:MAG: DNA polymerase III subunit beta [Verrucomicrobia bacterium]|nr:DNA polymerase III subunit beta [Verrucomicrobiota bacterium]
MKFSVSKEKLLAGLQSVQNVVSTRTTLPILSNVLLRSSNGQLRLTTTDLDYGVTDVITVQSEKDGSTTLPVRRLASIIRELPGAEVQIEVDSKHATSIRSGPSFFKINGLSEEEFPALPKFAEAKRYTLRQKDLRDALKKTSYAISSDDTRYVLNGIFFSFKDERLTMVATDGRRLALVHVEVEFPKSDELDVIVPTKCVNELGRLIGNEGDVQIVIGDNQIAFEIGDKLIISKMVEGNYPNYQQVIPGDAKERITLERESFLNAVHRVSLLNTDKSGSVKLTFTKNNLEIASSANGVGESNESIAVAYKGRDLSIAFNPEFLQAPLRALTEDEIFLDLIDEMSPGVIKIPTPFLYVLMPMRIS